MLGRRLSDPEGVEQQGEFEGLGLLPCETVFTPEKTRTRRTAVCTAAPFAGAALEGYEIHMGDTRGANAAFCRFADGTEDGAVGEGVFGTYLHGLFDSGKLTGKLAAWLAGRKGISVPDITPEPRAAYRNRQYDRLAEAVRRSLDMGKIYRAMEEFGDEAAAGGN